MGGPAGLLRLPQPPAARRRELAPAGFVKEEHNKLARIQLDFTNELDFAWDINVRKSRAVPPDALREDLIRIAKKTRDVARTIYRHRGATIARQHAELYRGEGRYAGIHFPVPETAGADQAVPPTGSERTSAGVAVAEDRVRLGF